MRRKDREVAGLADMLAILDSCQVMRLGLCTGDQPYIVPMNFAYELAGEMVCIYFHCASEGKKLEIIAKNSKACFEADNGCQILPAENACGWSANYQSVIGEGHIEVLNGMPQKVAGLDLLMGRYGYEGKPHYDLQAIEAVTVLKLTVASMTGKRRMD